MIKRPNERVMGSRTRRPLDAERWIMADRFTHKSKRILFVCAGGTGISRSAMDHFRKVAERKKRSVTYQRDFTGIHAPEFREKLAKADYVVPMLAGFVPGIRESVGTLERKPTVIDAKFETHADVSDAKRFERIFEDINKE